MKLILNRTWNGFRVGKVITPADGVANTLIRRGIARPAEEPVIEEATAEPHYERAVSRRKGR